MDHITLYYPGDGTKEDSNKVLYKNIKEFKDNNNGTVTFKTLKHGTITTPLPWRLAIGVPADAVEEAVAAPAGNQARKRVAW